MQWKTKAAAADDFPFLWGMLYQAIYVPKGHAVPSLAILKEPSIARFLEGWGREGDKAIIALNKEEDFPVGAVWIRQFDATNQT